VLSRYLRQTRLVRAPSVEANSKQKVFLKLESEMPTGSFKVRGAIYALGVHDQGGGVRKVAASSTGNHGAAVAYAAQLLSWKARIFLPENCNPVKRANIAQLGAEIVEKGALDSAAAFEAADEYARESGAFFLNDATDPDLPAGPGTIACEIFEQQPDVDTIYVPMGDTRADSRGGRRGKADFANSKNYWSAERAGAVVFSFVARGPGDRDRDLRHHRGWSRNANAGGRECGL